MAGSRAYLSGSIFQRVSGLLRSGAVKYEDRPLWYEVCAAFPPKVEPRLDRILPERKVPDIIYPEDNIRAKFYDSFDTTTCVINMVDKAAPDALCEKFIAKYKELAVSGIGETELLTRTAEALAAEGMPKLNVKETEATKVARVFESQKQAWTTKWEAIKRKPTAAETFGDKLSKPESSDPIESQSSDKTAKKTTTAAQDKTLKK